MAYEFGKGICINSDDTSKGKNSKVYTRMLYGESIHENPVPIWTSEKDNHPFVVFQDPVTSKKIGINKNMLSYGFLTMGDPGVGKTNQLNMMIETFLSTQECNEKLIIFDTKGDYFREFGSMIPKEEQILIGTGEEYRNITSYHNIFGEIMPRGKDRKLVYTRDTDTAAFNVAKQMFKKMNSETQPIFPAMAEQIVAGGMLYLIRTYWRSDQSKLNNKGLIEFFMGSTNEELKAIFELDYMKDYRKCVDYVSNTKGNQTQGVNSYIGSVIKEMFVGPFAESYPEKEFSMRDVVRSFGKRVVFIEYDLKLGETLAPMYGVLIDTALANALGGRQTDRNNVYFLLDEMLLLPPLVHLSNALNFGRSQGVKILCGLQNTSGLEDIYGVAGARRILASFQNITSFRISDFDTRQFIIDRLGTNYQNYSFTAQQENVHIQREGHTVEDWDLLALKLGEAVISLKDEQPFLFHMPQYK